MKTGGKRWFGKRPGLFISNSRFYILMFSLILSVIILCYLRVTVIGNTVFAIRLQQVYGFISLFYLYLALIATPLGTIFGKEGAMRQYLYARRALGVSAAYFATLHMLISLFGQLGGISNLGNLPGRFLLAVIFGFGALLTLLLMAATSFDKVIAWMTFPRWKWLHRFVYLATIIIFLHVWMLGTHIDYAWIRWSIFAALVLFAGLESWRSALLINKKTKGLNKPEFALLFISIFVSAVVFIVILPKTVDRFHGSEDAATHAGASR